MHKITRLKTLTKYLFAYLLFYLINVLSTFSQTYNFVNYSSKDGLSQSQINAIYEDSRGLLWVATAGGGICYFDGKTFTEYNETHGLIGNVVTSITEDNNGRLWFSSPWGGLACFNGQNFTTYSNKNNPELYNSDIVYFHPQTNKLYTGNAVGLFYFNNDKFNKILLTDDTLTYSVYDIQPYKNSILIASNKGLFILNKENKLVAVQKKYFARGINNICVYNDSLIILNALDDQIWELHGDLENGKIIQPWYAGFIQHHITKKIFRDSKSNLWIGTSKQGVFCINTVNKTFENFCKENGLNTFGVFSIYEDKNNNIWLGSNGKGLFKYLGKQFVNYHNHKELATEDIFSITQDENNNLYVGTINYGIYKFNGKIISHIKSANGKEIKRVRDLKCDTENNIWCATQQGLLKITPAGNTILFTTENGLPVNDVKSVLISKSGLIYVGTNGKGIAVIEKNKVVDVIDESKGLAHGYAHCLLEDGKGHVWIGTGNGLHKYADNAILHYSTKQGLLNTYIGSITEDKLGNIWCGTDKGISRFDGVKFKNFTDKDGLSSNTVYCLSTDNEGNIWCGTNKGIDKIILSAHGEITEIINYSQNQGYIGSESNTKASYKDSNGNIWVGTINGLIKINPNENKTINNLPQIHITDIKLFFNKLPNEAIAGDKKNWFGVPRKIILRHDQNQLNFSFKAVSLNALMSIKYTYKLEGFDKEWSPPTAYEEAGYSNLPSGKYVFKVAVTDKNGRRSQNFATVNITIKPAFWQSWWFAIALLGLVIFLIHKYNQSIQKNIQRYSNILEKKVAIRTAEIEKQSQEKEILLKEIHHRVKNNLQVIASLLNIQAEFVKDKQTIQALEESKSRIRSMALIHERLYETKDFSRVNISDYLDRLVKDLIETYGIQANIKLDKKITTESFGFDTVMPLALLMNEIITNSLKYAFKNREEGKIFFHLTKPNEHFELIIGDDGLGFDKKIFEKTSNTMGIELIKILTDQINGEIKLLNKPGTVYKIIFKGIDKKRY